MCYNRKCTDYLLCHTNPLEYVEEKLLHLRLFGSPQILYDGQTVTGFVSNKVRALLFYLATTGHPHSRELLAELLWADNPASARANLKKALSNLRTLSEIPLCKDSGRLEMVDLDRCWVDVFTFAQIAERPAAHSRDALWQASQLYTGDFLAGFNISLSYEFEGWALRQQAQLIRSAANRVSSTS